jgi:hypothetical protein
VISRTHITNFRQGKKALYPMGAFPFSGCFISIFLSGVQRITWINEFKPCHYGLARVKEFVKKASLPALCPPHQAVMLWPPCVRCPRSQGTRPCYLNGSTPTLEKKCPGYQRRLATAYRLSLARSAGVFN